MVPPTEGGALLHQLAIEKIPMEMAIANLTEAVLQLGFLLPKYAI